MRKITREALAAFMAGKPFNKQNTSVEVRPWQTSSATGIHMTTVADWAILKLHGNPIARYRAGDTSLRSLEVCDGGWTTRTTADRLNALPGVRVNIKQGAFLLNGEPWDGFWTKVTPQFTIHQDSVAKKLRWRVDFPRQQGRTPESLYFPTEAAAEAFVAIEEANMGLARRAA